MCVATAYLPLRGDYKFAVSGNAIISCLFANLNLLQFISTNGWRKRKEIK